MCVRVCMYVCVCVCAFLSRSLFDCFVFVSRLLLCLFVWHLFISLTFVYFFGVRVACFVCFTFVYSFHFVWFVLRCFCGRFLFDLCLFVHLLISRWSAPRLFFLSLFAYLEFVCFFWRL